VRFEASLFLCRMYWMQSLWCSHRSWLVKTGLLWCLKEGIVRNNHFYCLIYWRDCVYTVINHDSLGKNNNLILENRHYEEGIVVFPVQQWLRKSTALLRYSTLFILLIWVVELTTSVTRSHLRNSVFVW